MFTRLHRIQCDEKSFFAVLIRPWIGLILFTYVYSSEVKFGASYDGSYRPDSMLAPKTQTIWSRGGSVLPILPNVDGATVSPGIATFNDSSKKGRIQISLPLNKAFGRSPEQQEYTITFRAKFDPDGATMIQAVPPLAVAVVGFRDEDGDETFGRTVLLGYFLDIDAMASGLQPGLGLTDDNTRLIKEVSRVDFCDSKFHTFILKKYLHNGKTLLDILMDDKILAEKMDYGVLPLATRNLDGFGYFSSTPGTINCSIDSLCFGAPVQREIDPPNSDPRDIHNGYIILDNGYADQPLLVKNKDGSLTCVLTVSDMGEGWGTQHVVSVISLDGGRTWSEPVSIESPDSPESSWAVPIITPNGRIYVAYTYNSTNIRSIKMENGAVSNRVDTVGKYVYRFSDDRGRTWSHERYEIPIRVTDYDRTNVYHGDLNGDGKIDSDDPKFFWNPSRAEIANGNVYLGLAKIRNFRPIVTFAETEGFVFRSPNLLREQNPNSIIWEMVPEGRYGLRSRSGIVCEETTPLVLSDGTLAALCRTEEGVILAFYSSNQGNSWRSPEPLSYALDGKSLKNPRAKASIWVIGPGKYLLWYANNGNTGFENRNPAWLAYGFERDGQLVFSQPEVVLYDRNPQTRLSYPDFVQLDGCNLLTETQKSVARVHEVSKDLINGLIGQSTATGRSTIGLIGEWDSRLKPTQKLKDIPDIVNIGLTLEFWVKFDRFDRENILLDSMQGKARGVKVTTKPNRSVSVTISNGNQIIEAESDQDSLVAGRWTHIVCIFDPGPRILMFVINGRLSDGGAERVSGWKRYPSTLAPIADDTEVSIARNLNGKISNVWVYSRALRVSEAIAAFRTGRPSK